MGSLRRPGSSRDPNSPRRTIEQPGYEQQAYDQPPGYGQPPQGYAQPQGYGQMQPYGGHGPIGKVRSTGITILLFLVTLGIYGWYYFFKTHEEMKQHSGDGLGGPVALILAIFVGFVLPYIDVATRSGICTSVPAVRRRSARRPGSGTSPAC